MIKCNIILTCFFIICNFSCCNNIGETVEEMTGKYTRIPIDKMSCWINDSLIYNDSSMKARYKLVVYVDSMACSGCYLKNMAIWQDFIKFEDANNFKIFFIFAPRNGVESLQNSFWMTGLFHPMYIDASCNFLKVNPHIPKEPMFHTFLLDENNKIILVGSPLRNEKIEKMLFDILDEKLGKQTNKTKNSNSK